jgi:hypothetical protein
MGRLQNFLPRLVLLTALVLFGRIVSAGAADIEI